MTVPNLFDLDSQRTLLWSWSHWMVEEAFWSRVWIGIPWVGALISIVRSLANLPVCVRLMIQMYSSVGYGITEPILHHIHMDMLLYSIHPYLWNGRSQDNMGILNIFVDLFQVYRTLIYRVGKRYLNILVSSLTLTQNPYLHCKFQ